MLKLKKIIKEDELTGSLKLKIDNFLINYLDYLILAVAAIILVLGLWLFIYPQYLQIVQDENARKKIQTEYACCGEMLIQQIKRNNPCSILPFIYLVKIPLSVFPYNAILIEGTGFLVYVCFKQIEYPIWLCPEF